MVGRGGPKRVKVRGNQPKAHFSLGLAETVSETVRIWRKQHLGYDQTKYVVEQARRRLKLQPVGTRRRTVNRLDKSEVERLIRNSYQSRSKYGLMIKTLFLSGARVDEFVHIRVEELHLDSDPVWSEYWICMNVRWFPTVFLPAIMGFEDPESA